MPEWIPAPQLPTGLAEETIRQRANRPNPWVALAQGVAPYAQMYGEKKMGNAMAEQRETASLKLNSMPADQLQQMLERIRSGGGAPGGGSSTAPTGWGTGVHPSIPATWSSFSEGWE